MSEGASPLENDRVKAVAAALKTAGSPAEIQALAKSARSAEEAADALGVEPGAIVKSLVYTIDGKPVMALVAGDHRCRENQLGRTLNLTGEIRRPKAEDVRQFTGFAIGGVAPIGCPEALPTALDVSLRRFDRIYAAAGHPHCVFATDVDELRRLTKAIISYAIAEPL